MTHSQKSPQETSVPEVSWSHPGEYEEGTRGRGEVYSVTHKCQSKVDLCLKVTTHVCGLSEVNRGQTRTTNFLESGLNL